MIMPHSERGKLIVFEGLDRSGKSTQSSLLAKYLQEQGHSVSHLRFPNRSTPIGQMISSYLQNQSEQEDHVIHLLFSANRWESAGEIDRLIAAGTMVVVDRYYYSGCVYSAAKQRPGMDLEWCRHPEVGLPRPDVCFFFDLDAAEAERRGGFGQERYERKEMQGRVRELYARMRESGDEGEDMVMIDAGRTLEEVEQEVRRVVNEICRKVDGEAFPLRTVRPW